MGTITTSEIEAMLHGMVGADIVKRILRAASGEVRFDAQALCDHLAAQRHGIRHLMVKKWLRENAEPVVGTWRDPSNAKLLDRMITAF